MGLQNRPVLVVDDDPDMRIVIRKILENAGMRVFEAESVRQALEVADKSPPHLVILDLQMPGEGGLRFLEKKLGNPAFQSVPVMVVSAVTDREAVYSAVVSGAVDYLIKPFSTAILVQKVRKALKDTEFKVVRFAKDKRPKATCLIPAEISKVSETSFLLESSAKLAPNCPIQVQGEIFYRAGIHSCVFRTAMGESLKGASGQYVGRIHVSGLSETLTKKVSRAKGAKS
jgi:DNA-binding NtrC family response regulator